MDQKEREVVNDVLVENPLVKGEQREEINVQTEEVEIQTEEVVKAEESEKLKEAVEGLVKLPKVAAAKGIVINEGVQAKTPKKKIDVKDKGKAKMVAEPKKKKMKAIPAEVEEQLSKKKIEEMLRMEEAE